MQLKKGEYRDLTADIIYNLNDEIPLTGLETFILEGENGVGKTRFTEGVLLKELKKNNIKMLYFGQDIENQILSFELISLVKTFIGNLKREGSFFKTVFLNDDSHSKTELDFNEKSTLSPDSSDIKKFILKECKKYDNAEVIIFDEADKYFDTEDDFISLIESFSNKTVFLISHIIDSKKLSNSRKLKLKKLEEGVEIGF